MRSKQLLSAAAILLGVLLLWQIASMQSDIAALRADLAKAQAAPTARTEAPHGDFPAAHETASSNSTGFERMLEELQQTKDRVAELESTVSELSDAWNQFAADEEAKRRKASMRSWGPEQATGAPDTLQAGDRATAWASAQPDGRMEWLQTEYERPVEIAQVRILENEAPGAVVKITATTAGGGEVVLWQGEEPRVPAPADQVFPAAAGIVAQSIRIYLDTSKMPGWNEIDAVELIGRDGSRQWARSATASSTYADRTGSRANVFDNGMTFLLR